MIHLLRVPLVLIVFAVLPAAPVSALKPPPPTGDRLWLLCEADQPCDQTTPCALVRLLDPETWEERVVHFVSLNAAPEDAQSRADPEIPLGGSWTARWEGAHLVLGAHVQLINERGPLRGVTLDVLDLREVRRELRTSEQRICEATTL